jgi:multidrug efflux pump subunit AcrB
MLGIVRLALSRPYTFVVMAILIAIFGVRAALLTPTDIFPNIGIPVISVIWTYAGLPVPARTGAIMCMGVATANSILVISFAREQLTEGHDALSAAMAAGSTRFRPVLMTALAMIIGMAPMAIGADQNAPLGRAVVGGLVFATCATLLLVPTLFSLVHARDHVKGAAKGQPAALPAPAVA